MQVCVRLCVWCVCVYISYYLSISLRLTGSTYPKNGQKVSVHYTGTLDDGTKVNNLLTFLQIILFTNFYIFVFSLIRHATATSPSSSPSARARLSAAGMRALLSWALASAPSWSAHPTMPTEAVDIQVSFLPTLPWLSMLSCSRSNKSDKSSSSDKPKQLMCMCVSVWKRETGTTLLCSCSARTTNAHTHTHTDVSRLHLVLGLRNALEQNQTRTIQQHFNYIQKKRGQLWVRL